MIAPAPVDVLIVGTGHGGAGTAIALRKLGFEGSILLLGKEPDLPYERPPLTKDYLAGDKPLERILLRPAAFWGDHHIQLRPASEVVAIDPDAKLVTLSDGATLAFRTLVWAAGGRPRRLTCDGADLGGVHSVRDRSDVDRLRSELAAGARRVVVVGGGYIGLEAAAVLTGLGAEVIVLEALDRVLARVAGEPLSRYFEGLHRAHGVDIRLGVQVACVEGQDGRVTGVRLADGERLDADMVIVGIGIEPAMPPYPTAAASGGNGVSVDSQCRTAFPDIYAVGDCAAHFNRFAGGARIRLESVQNATDMALTAARAITGAGEDYEMVPWFWSTQYDARLQTVGFNLGFDQTIVRGDPDDGAFSIIYLRDGTVIALDCVNSTRDYVQGRKLVEAASRPDPDRLADQAVSLKDCL